MKQIVFEHVERRRQLLQYLKKDLFDLLGIVEKYLYANFQQKWKIFNYIFLGQTGLSLKIEVEGRSKKV